VHRGTPFFTARRVKKSSLVRVYYTYQLLLTIRCTPDTPRKNNPCEAETEKLLFDVFLSIATPHPSPFNAAARRYELAAIKFTITKRDDYGASKILSTAGGQTSPDNTRVGGRVEVGMSDL